MTLQTEAIPVKEARNFLAYILKLLQIRQHRHAQSLHLHHIVIGEHLTIKQILALSVFLTRIAS